MKELEFLPFIRIWFDSPDVCRHTSRKEVVRDNANRRITMRKSRIEEIIPRLRGPSIHRPTLDGAEVARAGVEQPKLAVVHAW